MRAIRANDGPTLLEAFDTLDQESIYRRAFGVCYASSVVEG